MLYTYQRRKALNKAVREMFPEVKFHESANGVPVMECITLPSSVIQINDADMFFRNLTQHCSKGEQNGIRIPDFNKTLPVFIKSMELTGDGSRQKNVFYRVNYVSISEVSMRKAEEYIAEGKLYAVMPTKKVTREGERTIVR